MYTERGLLLYRCLSPPAPEIFQGRGQLDLCGQWVYLLAQPNIKKKIPLLLQNNPTPSLEQTASHFPWLMLGEEAVNIERQRHRRYERDR